MKGDNSELRRGSGGVGRGICRFLGGRILFEGTSGEEILEGVDDLNLTCLGFDFMGFNYLLEFFSETSTKMEKPHSSSYASSYALQDLQHYIETTSKIKKKVI